MILDIRSVFTMLVLLVTRLVSTTFNYISLRTTNLMVALQVKVRGSPKPVRILCPGPNHFFTGTI